MKYFTFILVTFLTLNLSADGGGNDKITINDYEPNLNLQFIGITDTIHYPEKKRALTAIVTSNVAIYDMTNNKTNYIFKDTVKRQIVGFYFESQYINEFKTIEFNNSYDPGASDKSGLFQHSNNRNVSDRPISKNLIIVTEDPVTKNLTFWICDKYGNNIKKELEINKDWSWEIDVKNQCIRISRQVNLKIDIKNIKY